jgi:prepilin-type N-terminal cleavage/methylation domain-containing protein
MRQLTSPSRRPGAWQRGFTLIELMVGVAIVMVLTVAGLPSFTDYVENARLREGANLIVTGTLMARSEAIKRNLAVRVTVDHQRLVVTQDDGTPLRSVELPETLQTSSFVATYDSSGRLAPFGTDIVVPISSTRRVCDAVIRCPAVHLEAGGAVALCTTGACG